MWQGGHFSKLNSTRLNRTHGTFGVSWPDGRIVRIVAKLTDIPVLVSNACHFIYYTHTHTHTGTYSYTNKHTYTHTRMVLLTSCFAFYRLKMRKLQINTKSFSPFSSVLRFSRCPLSSFARNNVAGATKLFTRLFYLPLNVRVLRLFVF